MKLAIITSHISKSLQWLWVSEGLRDRGLDHIHIIINETEPILKRDLESAGIKVYWRRHTGTFSHLINLVRVMAILIRERVDIVHTSLPYGNLAGQLAALLCGIRLRLTTCENASWAHDFANCKQELIDSLTHRLARVVVATSETARQYLKQHWGIPDGKLLVIPHALKQKEFESMSADRVERMKKSLGVEAGDFIVGVVARFEYWKGHGHIVEAVRMIADRHPDLKVLIFGAQGSGFDEVMGKVRDYGLGEVIQYKGFVDDPLALYRIFDVHLHVPINEYVETFGINIIEGMMSGCPQILTRSGVAFTSARDRENCLVVDYCDPKGIAAAIEELKRDHKLRVRLGAQARLDAIRDFDIRKKVDRHIQLYEELVAGK